MPALFSSSRRGRPLFLVALATFALVFLARNVFSSSRHKIANYLGSKPKVNEIYGLLYLVTRGAEQQHTLSDAVDVDPKKPINFSVYSGGKRWIDWKKEAQRLDDNFPIIVFSKTYCPYSKRAKNLLASYDIQPSPHIVEVDLRGDGALIKALLTRMTGRGTFPNTLVRGRSIGGSDDLFSLHESSKLAQILQDAGAEFRTQDV
ncbi:Thioredoxin-like fold [Amanita muscaria]